MQDLECKKEKFLAKTRNFSFFRLIHKYFVSMEGFTDNGEDIEYIVGIVTTESDLTNCGCRCGKF